MYMYVCIFTRPLKGQMRILGSNKREPTFPFLLWKALYSALWSQE